jgi:hypothetical protein
LALALAPAPPAYDVAAQRAPIPGYPGMVMWLLDQGLPKIVRLIFR